MSKLSRLDFIRYSAIGAASTLIVPRTVSAAIAPKKEKKGRIQDLRPKR